jgi:uncharacterized membrane protein YebE (DUF533 family)
MFDARQLLDQVLSSVAPGASDPTDASARQRQGGGALSQAGGSSHLLTGALAGGVLGLLAGNKRARKFAGKTAGTALKLGGLAAVAAVGYTAWQRHKAGAAAPSGTAVAGTAAPLQLPPADSAFAPSSAPDGADALARGVLVAMIQGAKADGHVDAEEQGRIFAQVESLGLNAEAKAFVMDELAAPQSLARVVAHATTPEVATELYAASLLAMDPDTPAERAYLDRLATALEIEPGLAAQIEAAVRSEIG